MGYTVFVQNYHAQLKNNKIGLYNILYMQQVYLLYLIDWQNDQNLSSVIQSSFRTTLWDRCYYINYKLRAASDAIGRLSRQPYSKTGSSLVSAAPGPLACFMIFIHMAVQNCTQDFTLYTDPGFFTFLRSSHGYLLGSSRIDSKKSILQAYVAWRAGTTTLFLFSSQPPQIV